MWSGLEIMELEIKSNAHGVPRDQARSWAPDSFKGFDVLVLVATGLRSIMDTMWWGTVRIISSFSVAFCEVFDSTVHRKSRDLNHVSTISCAALSKTVE